MNTAVAKLFSLESAHNLMPEESAKISCENCEAEKGIASYVAE